MVSLIQIAILAAFGAAATAGVNPVANAGSAAAPLKALSGIVVNQQAGLIHGGVADPLGVFSFGDGPAELTISNEGADGFVVIDAVQFVPIALAKAERAAAEAERAKAEARRTVRIMEPVQLARSAAREEVGGRTYDVVVVEGTPAGVACAVRAAREGASVLLVHHNRHLGGIMANGLGQWDALFGGHRAPLFSELLRNIESYYRDAYGENSRDYLAARFTQQHYPLGWTEPHVAEREFNRLVAGESRIALLLDHEPAAVERDGPLLRSATFRQSDGKAEVRVKGAIFVDASYEGDLIALAGAAYRVGRESRDEYGEPHAGKVFTNIAKGPAPRDAVEGRLNIRPYGARQGSIDPASPFSADRAVQAYNYRLCLSRDPDNRILLDKPPANYRREEFLNYDRKYLAASAGPNQKSHMNSAILPGENHAYPEGDRPTRQKILQRHLDFALGLMYFLQNDESIPAARRAEYRNWGLPKDEFQDNNHVPYEMYVREARRLVGRHVYSEQDNSIAPGAARTPIQPDSVAITDWYMDSHSCTTDSRPGYRYDGKLILTEESRPGQIPYRSLLPQGIDNLLVPVCLSATHVAWGAVRLEPVYMQTGEAAGMAAALARQLGTTPGKLDPDLLLRRLVERRMVVSFFNDVNGAGKEPWIPAVQYFGAKGFFASYNARPDEPLTDSVARVWVEAFGAMLRGSLDPQATAVAVAKVEGQEGPAITAGGLADLLAARLAAEGRHSATAESVLARTTIPRDQAVSRAEACRLMFALLGRKADG